MFCNQCGRANSNDAKFCSGCGNKLEIQNIQSSPIPQQPIQTEMPQRKKQVELWNPNATANWSLLFTPIFGSYLQMKNWQTLGKLEEAQNAKLWLFFTIGFILFINFGTPFIWDDPEQASTMSKGLGFWYIIIWYFAYAKKQPKYVKENLNDKYQKKSWLIPLISAMVILFIAAFIIIVISSSIYQQRGQQTTKQINVFDPVSAVPYEPPPEKNPFADPNYGKELSNNQQTLQPFYGKTDEELAAEKAHFDAILKVHSDAYDVVESQYFHNWVNSQSPNYRKYYNDVMDKGSATQVIEMLTNYKNGTIH